MVLTNAEKQKRWRERRNALAANEALRNRAMDATQYYPHLSQWPTSAPVPTHALLVQAYALLRAARPRARPEGSHKALAVAAYLSGHYWWPDDLARAIDRAMGKQNGAANDPRNVITERRTGLERLGLVTLHKQRNGRRELWSCKLTAEGERVVPAAERQVEAPLDEQDQEVAVSDAATGPTRGPVPSSCSGTVSRDANSAVTTYAFRFGKRNVWKIGWATVMQDRLSEVNQHIPHEVLGERWSITTWQQSWRNQNEAYEMEQRLLTLLAERRTEGERVQCTEDELRAAWIGASAVLNPRSSSLTRVE